MTAPKTFISEEDRQMVLQIYEAAEEMLKEPSVFPPSRETSLAITNLQQSRMWAFASLRVEYGGQP